ncbi:MAG: ATP-binding cassette domain-containing protein [Dehalococcoidales bacterium]|nr:ATP-binding cassette domain-containing protein [Dehalococcoidales bacterium]
MHAVEASHLVKAFADKVAVNDLSFSVDRGQVFGMIGPNGAGKTTTIRMMMDIIKPDSGEVTILGEKLGAATKNKLGYLPEEKGMYKKLKVSESIAYLASLKGMDRSTIGAKADELLQKIGMLDTKKKKIEEMSKGMGQIIQFVTTIIHDPELIVMDEPFSGLDPVNTELLKGMLLELRNEGKAVILSTHQMNQVEELCDRVLMVNHGKAVLYGELGEIKSKYKGDSILLDGEGDTGEIAGVSDKRKRRGYIELLLNGERTPQQILEQLMGRGVKINRFEIATPSLNEIFLMEAGKKS